MAVIQGVRGVTVHGLTIGSDMSAGVRDVIFRDTTLNGTQYGARFKLQSGRSGLVSDILDSNLQRHCRHGN
jgi:polygalacturonase